MRQEKERNIQKLNPFKLLDCNLYDYFILGGQTFLTQTKAVRISHELFLNIPRSMPHNHTVKKECRILDEKKPIEDKCLKDLSISCQNTNFDHFFFFCNLCSEPKFMRNLHQQITFFLSFQGHLFLYIIRNQKI